MFLKLLKISSDKRIIREINFHQGINLIVDDTPNEQETGNGVGKTTVLALIDFCLNGDAKNIYTDTENKKQEYKLVKNFLIVNKILITLILKEDLSNQNSKQISIERNFLSRKHKIQKINGIEKNDEEFEKTLTELLFNYRKDKPSLRQIISHNIRYKDYNVNNTLKTLNPYTKDEEYETLYLFLLGCSFEQGDNKQKLLTKIKS